MATKEAFKKKLKLLVNRFQEFESENKRQIYNETLTRRDFIDPFFKALGWDIDNEQGLSFDSREVIHEDQLKIQGKFKAPDYCFRVDGKRKFFVEAKKPSVDLKQGFSESLQLRRYGWNGETALSILTDFEELVIYDTRIKPKLSDTSKIARIEYIKYTEYLDKWEFIYDIFSKEAVEGGKFDEFVGKPVKGMLSVDKDFLETISNWRDWLAKDIAINNRKISIEDLNLTVQKFIDRIIFLRIAEDRGLEEYGNLETLVKYKDSYKRLVEHFAIANKKYDSNLFEFESGLTPNLKISDKVLDKILDDLYYPTSPYEFSVIGVELLGKIYEQFLGKVIRLTLSHNAVVEEKPEVRKAGGVYYTPKYIVDYIVKNTVGELIKGKTPKQIEKITIVDPACGSGSFLIGAYEFLLQWHLNYYTKSEPSMYRDALYRDSLGNWRLTTAEKRKILLNNIYGVDIDKQAVEVTKLSLSLKMLEDENRETINHQLKIFTERILPDLESNIKCGNSLIGNDYWDDKDMNKISEEEIKRVNAFDWAKEFSEIFKQNGFDGVIGNPPYLRIQGLQEHYKEEVLYYHHSYESAIKRFDLYLLFIEKGYKILKKNGILSFINPHKFISGDFGSGVRNFLIKNKALESIVSFGSYPVFESASTYTGIMKLSKENKDKFKFYEINSKTELTVQGELTHIPASDFTIYKYNLLTNSPWSLTNQFTQEILNKIQKLGKPLWNFFEEIAQGVVTGIDEIYFLKITSNTNLTKEVTRVYSARIKQEIEIESKIIKPTLRGEDVSRFIKPEANIVSIYPYREENGKTRILELDELQSLFPLAYSYLNRFKSELIGIRKAYKTNPKYWYSCHRGRKISLFESLRVITPEISLGCNMTIGEPGIYHNTMVYSLLPKSTSQEDLYYWLGLLNSNVLWWFLTNTGNVLRGGYFRFKTNYLKPFPTRPIDFKNPEDRKYHDAVVETVNKLLAIHSKLKGTSGEMSVILKQQASKAENELNAIIYELYNLNQKEIEIIVAALPK